LFFFLLLPFLLLYCSRCHPNKKKTNNGELLSLPFLHHSCFVKWQWQPNKLWMKSLPHERKSTKGAPLWSNQRPSSCAFWTPPNSKGLALFGLNSQRSFTWKNKYKNIKIAMQASLETKIHERMMFAPRANLLHKQLVITQNKHTTTQHLLLNNFCA
jgi:hypothetical protein